MTIPVLPDTARQTTYNISASTGPLSVGFDIYADGSDYSNWIEVWVEGVKLTPVTQFTVDSPSGTLSDLARPITDARVTFVSAQTGDVVIVGARRPRRTSVFNSGQAIPIDTQNYTINDLMSAMREFWDLRDRMFLVAAGEQAGVIGNDFGDGNVLGAASSTDNAVTRFDGTTGKTIQGSALIVDDNGDATGLRNQTSTGNQTIGGYHDLTEISTPSSPSANHLRLYAKDVAGVTRPMVVDSAGTETDLIGAWTNVRLAKTSNYSLANADKGKTIALGGTAFFTLTVGAASGFDADFAVAVVNEDSGRGKTLAINGYSNFILWPGQAVLLFNQNSAWKFNSPGRWRLTADTTFRVNHASGADTSDGLSTGSAALRLLSSWQARHSPRTMSRCEAAR